MKILRLFEGSDAEHGLKPLDVEELADLEALLIEKMDGSTFAV